MFESQAVGRRSPDFLFSEWDLFPSVRLPVKPIERLWMARCRWFLAAQWYICKDFVRHCHSRSPKSESGPCLWGDGNTCGKLLDWPNLQTPLTNFDKLCVRWMSHCTEICQIHQVWHSHPDRPFNSLWGYPVRPWRMPAANAWLKNHPWFYNVRILIHDIAKLPCGEGWQVAVRGNKIGWKCFSFHRKRASWVTLIQCLQPAAIARMVSLIESQMVSWEDKAWNVCREMEYGWTRSWRLDVVHQESPRSLTTLLVAR